MNFHTCAVALHLRTEISDVVRLDMSNQQNNSCDFISKRPMCCVEEISYIEICTTILWHVSQANQ